MAKGGVGKLGKLKCMIKRWHTTSKQFHRSNGSSVSTTPTDDDVWKEPLSADIGGGGVLSDKVPLGFHPVYVGKSRRRYLISSHLVDHPLFRELAQRSGGNDVAAAATVVGCEVVLFEHLLWMLENADPQPESLGELVEFYAC